MRRTDDCRDGRVQNRICIISMFLLNTARMAVAHNMNNQIDFLCDELLLSTRDESIVASLRNYDEVGHLLVFIIIN